MPRTKKCREETMVASLARAVPRVLLLLLAGVALPLALSFSPGLGGSMPFFCGGHGIQKRVAARGINTLGALSPEAKERVNNMASSIVAGKEEMKQRKLFEARLEMEARLTRNDGGSDAMKAGETAEESIDVFIPYDAAARLAYESSDKSTPYAEFKEKFEADAVAEVVSKNAKEESLAAVAKMEDIEKVSEKEEENAESPPPVATIDFESGTKSETPPVPAAKVATPELPTTTLAEVFSDSGVPRELSIVPVNEDTVQFTAGILGGAAGLALGGGSLPLAAAFAAAVNLASKDEGEVGKAVQALSRSFIEFYNYLAELDAKYTVVYNAQQSLINSLDALKKRDNVNVDAVNAVETALAKTTSTLIDINDEFDVVNGIAVALGALGDAIAIVARNVKYFDEENRLTERLLSSLREVAEQAKKNREAQK